MTEPSAAPSIPEPEPDDYDTKPIRVVPTLELFEGVALELICLWHDRNIVLRHAIMTPRTTGAVKSLLRKGLIYEFEDGYKPTEAGLRALIAWQE